MPIQAPIAGDAGTTGLLQSSMAAGPAVPGAGADMMNAQFGSARQALEQIALQMQTLAGQFPIMAPDIQQAEQILKGAVIKLAQAAAMQTMSGANVPGNGLPGVSGGGNMGGSAPNGGQSSM